jgi:superoxide oxidase
MIMTSREKYTPLRVGLHWLTALLFVAVYATMELREFYPKGSGPREALKAWHAILGLTVLGLAVLRLLARTTQPDPVALPAPLAQQRLASFVHLCLYGLMLVMPILGWLILSTAGKPIPFWGFQLPALLAVDADLSHQIKEVHEFIGTLGYGLVGLHALAALYHHYFVKDSTLRRMWL